MARSLCLIHANCQGDPLHLLLKSTPAFARVFEVKKYTNYLRENIPAEDFAHCGLLLFQELSDTWGEHATSALVQKLPTGAQALKIPNMFFNGYWPLWTNQTHMAYGDLLLEHLAELGLGPQEILHVYLRGDIAAKFDLQELVRASRQREEHKEENVVIPTLPYIDTYWQEEQLFHTVNHPGPRLLLHVADGVLKALGMPVVPASVRKAFAALPEEFKQPIHPQVGTLHNLPFASAERLYPVFGQELTFAQFAAAYVHCRLLKDSPAAATQDFVVYLHLLAEREGKNQGVIQCVSQDKSPDSHKSASAA